MCILENSLTLSSYKFHIFQSFLKLPLGALKKSAKYNILINVFDTFVFAVISDRGASIADRKLPVKPVLTEVGWLQRLGSVRLISRTIIVQFNQD